MVTSSEVQTRWPWALVATCCAPLVLRVAALRTEAGALSAIDLHGFASDLAMALPAAALLVALGAAGRVLPVLFAVVWSVGHYANFELVRVLGAPASLRDAHFLFDPTFAAGSAVAISRPGLLAAVTVVSGVCAARGAATARGYALGAAALGAALTLALLALPEAPEQPAWRQADFLQRDLVQGVRGLLAPAAVTAGLDPPAAMLERVPSLAADLSGATRLAGGARARNVLLVVLESVSGVDLESLAQEQGRHSDASMPRLDALAGRSLRFASFVTHQRKTDRGLYALLCGELPNLGAGTPKMSAAVESAWRVCLPEVLSEAGYHTAYLQAAPLAFMMKDRFMPRAGFQEVHGHDWFGHAYTRSAWGVDDRAFFEQAGRRIEALHAGSEPWFVTLMTVGTHHPFVVPDDFQPGRGRSFRRAAAYLDVAFGAFVERLEAAGVLDDTLLLVTSDESIGIRGFDTQPYFKMLSQNWGLLLVQGPGVQPGVVRQPYGLVDVALSIADYLGLQDRAGRFFGRSVFRRYDTPRPMFFANVNLGSLGEFTEDGKVLLCTGSGACRLHAATDGRVFGLLPEGGPAPEPEVAQLRDLARRSAPRGVSRPRAYALLADPDVRLEDGRSHMLHGGQFVSLEAGEWLEVEYDVRVEGDPSAVVDVVHRLTTGHNQNLLQRHTRLASGQRLTLRYEYVPDGPVDQIQCRTVVRRVAGERVVLHHDVARMRIRSGEGRPAPGARVEAFAVTRG